MAVRMARNGERAYLREKITFGDRIFGGLNAGVWENY